MAFDLSWLWDLLNTIVSTMQSWFSSLWSVAQSITNTGQGLFAGLVAFGSQLWDAIIKGATEFGTWLKGAFEWIYSGLKYVSDIFGQWFYTAVSWVGSAISWIGTQFYNFGTWLYNLAYFVWSWIVNSITALWNTLVSWFSGVASAIGTWWGSVITGINTWFTNLLKTFRQKIITTISADLTITMAWKGAERFLAPQKLTDFGYGLVGIIASPIIGRLVGVVVDAVVPLPSTSSYPLIPDLSGFSYSPPSLEIPPPTEKPPPEIGYITPPAVGYGLPYDKLLTLKKWTYDFTTASNDKTLIPSLSYESYVDTTDLSLPINLSYEYEVT